MRIIVVVSPLLSFRPGTLAKHAAKEAAFTERSPPGASLQDLDCTRASDLISSSATFWYSGFSDR